MRSPAPAPDRAPPRPRTANDRLKDRWNGWFYGSLTLAALLHLALFVWSPLWRVPEGERGSNSRLVQIVPMLGPELLPARLTLPEAPHTPDRADRPALASEVASAAADRLADAADRQEGRELQSETPLSPRFDRDAESPRIVAPKLVRWEPDPAFGTEALELSMLAPLTPRATPEPAAMTWPTIRNPNAITRFLRKVYNPIARQPGATGYVSVDMWIDEKGGVDEAQISGSSGSEQLDQIALQLFREVADFAPARREGVPIPVFITISVPFTVPW